MKKKLIIKNILFKFFLLSVLTYLSETQVQQELLCMSWFFLTVEALAPDWGLFTAVNSLWISDFELTTNCFLSRLNVTILKYFVIYQLQRNFSLGSCKEGGRWLRSILSVQQCEQITCHNTYLNVAFCQKVCWTILTIHS